jgi:multidrug resistance protein
MTRARPASLLVVFLTVFIDLIGFGMVMPLLPLYGERYGPPPIVLGLLLASFSVCQFVFAPILGRLSDRVGRRPVLILSLAGSAAGYLLFAVARSLPLLFASRIIDGISGANIATAQAVIADTTAPEERARGMGLIGTAFGLGFVLGPFLGGVLAARAESLPGFFAAFLSLAAMTIAIVALPETLPAKRGGGTRADAAPPRIAPLRALAAAIARPQLRAVLAALFLMTFAFSNFEATFSQFLHATHGYAPSGASWIFAYVGLIAAATQGAVIGMLARRMPESHLAAVGGVLAAAGLLAIPSAAPPGALLASLALLAGGVGLLSPSIHALASRLAADDEQGGVLGAAQSFGALARILGPIAGQSLYGGIGAAVPYVVGGILMGAVGALAALRLPALPRVIRTPAR